MAEELVRLDEETFGDWTERRRHQTLFCGVISASCAESAPIEALLRDLHATGSSRVAVATIDADKSPALAKRYDVEAFPEVLIFRDGQLATRLVPRC